ncbi:hypothetical protein M3196_00045 [Fictibacillus nanhaiensis]|uniref:hypothetical protein n=1 Tax=Fictibacillus nanhaiensis TaxID=742169 RepID=UPI00203CCBFB|nr:hypothetical protein [Fictibacillus nanhaiensis]MCM3730059.1 hypothetical protein [Fictibacillus nanhaiensis]
MIIALIVVSVVLFFCIDLLITLYKENKRLRDWKQSRIEFDQRLRADSYEKIRLSCEQIDKDLKEWNDKYASKTTETM